MVSHPSQISPLAYYRSAVVEAYEHMSGGIALMEGKFIECPVYISAKRLLSAAESHDGEQ